MYYLKIPKIGKEIEELVFKRVHSNVSSSCKEIVYSDRHRSYHRTHLNSSPPNRHKTVFDFANAEKSTLKKQS